MTNPRKADSPESLTRTILRYALAPLAIALTFLLATTSLYFNLGQPFAVLSFCAIALVFWYGGIGPGILAAILAAVVRILVPEPGLPGISRFGLEIVLALFTILMIQATRIRHELEWRVASRTADLSQANEGLKNEIAERKRAEALLSRDKRVLEMVAKGDPLPTILDAICRLVEEHTPGTLASILLLEGDRLRHGAAPSLPTVYTKAIDGATIGPLAGSCGTAAYRGEQVIVEDIATDPLWADYRQLALPHSLHACWSTPVFAQGKVIATFAMYYREPRKPGRRDHEIIEQVTHLAGVAIERERTQDALRRSQAYLAESQKMTLTGSWAINSALDITYWSDEAFQVFGIEPTEFPGVATFLQRVHPEDREQVRQQREQCFLEKQDYIANYRVVWPDGTVRHVHAIGHPVISATGEVIEFVGTVMDVTERKRAEEELHAAETRFRTYVDHATDALFVHDEEGMIIDVNQKACESLGYPREELIGCLPVMFDVGLNDAQVRWVREQLDAGAVFDFETAHRRKDGSTFPAEVRVRPFVHAGRQFGLALARDITDRKRAEQEHERLHQLQTELAHINRVTTLGELTASLAHEINQPITAAVTDANSCMRWLAADPPNLDRARDAAKRVVKDATRAAEIMVRTRMLFQKTPPRFEPVNIDGIIIEMAALLQSTALRQGVTIRTAIAAHLPQVMGDRVQLQQVLMNLMINGIEAMKQVAGRRELTLSCEAESKDQLLVAVKDTGPGLPPDTDRLFDAFFTTKSEGTGMGLAISRSIIEAHGGRLWALSGPDGGARFCFTLKAAIEARA